MGRYNVYYPQILGQEWVPIRDEDLTFAPTVNVAEIGHRFYVSTIKNPTDARFYVNQFPAGDPNGQVMLAAIYPSATLAESGPIQSVIIPCVYGNITGGAATVSGATTIAAALLSPSDNAFVDVTASNSLSMDLRFAVEQYAQALVGKRILNIDFLYNIVYNRQVNVANDADTEVAIRLMLKGQPASTLFFVSLLSGATQQVSNVDISRIKIGEIDPHWNSGVQASDGEVLPWTYTRLRGYDPASGTGTPPRWTQIQVVPAIGTNTNLEIHYAALEVFFCEERRVAFGGRIYSSPSIGGAQYQYGANRIVIRQLNDATPGPNLSLSSYDLVVSSGNVGDNVSWFSDVPTAAAPYPELNAVRQLYGLFSHPASKILIPFPMGPDVVGEEFNLVSTDIVPQLSLHDSSGTITETHVYGRQAAAQVYGTYNATQEILDAVAGGAGSYPWVRFYARRFGHTTVPLKLDSPTITGSSAEITPTDFDALDEIVDGWKEVTLRFATPPSMGTGTNPQWRWTARGELGASRWEILGAIAPALSGIAGNLINLVPSPNQLSLGTYGAPTSGANINLAWIPQYAPMVSSVSDDVTSDAVILFSQDPPTITGFSVSEQNQTVTGIGLDCGVNPCCVPSQIKYHKLTWSPGSLNASSASDSFTRVVAANSWGTADSGQTWTPDSTANITYSVDGSRGVAALLGVAGTGSRRANLVNAGSVNQEVYVELASAATGSMEAGVVLRAVDGANNYQVKFILGSPNQPVLTIYRVSGGAEAAIAQVQLWGLTSLTNATIKVKAQVIGSRIFAKAWSDTQDEPDWLIDTTDTTIVNGTNAGVAVENITVPGSTTYFDNFSVQAPDAFFGAYEIQRMDTVETDWKTIMMATSPAVTAFNDYEARVGIQSSYRIRALNLYDFVGPWSSTVSHTLTSPGVTIGCTGGHLLIFTSNEEQDGSVNLAYSSVWEGSQGVEEGFVFPEAQFVQLQAMYNRDFFTAFRPMERGGEQFARNVLVQAAAIAPETLADFTSLRDMAWADTSYICVRDEDGNRWFATVLVPSGRVLRDRRLYLAPVEIIEVTDTPSQVNP